MSHEIVLGLGFGDESKGAAVDWLCSMSPKRAVIRFNGGPQCAHNVMLLDGRHHTFSQFGAGTFRGVPTYLSQYMLVNPFNLIHEADHLASVGVDTPMDLVSVSEDALLVTPYHAAANQWRERTRGAACHGSTGQGVGEARAYALEEFYPPKIGDLRHWELLWRKLGRLHDWYTARGVDLGNIPDPMTLTLEYRQMHDDGVLNIVPSSHVETLLDSGDCVFEGAQGVLLDELYGFNPHTTWTNTTTRNALKLLDGRDCEVWGLTRAYQTRHGAGPFPTENFGVPPGGYRERHNGWGTFQGGWRQGALDLSLLRYAVSVSGGVDRLLVSHLDAVAYGPPVACEGYVRKDTSDVWLGATETLGAPYTLAQSEELAREIAQMTWTQSVAVEVDELLALIEDAAGVPVEATAWGPTSADRRLRKSYLDKGVYSLAERVVP